MGSAFAKKLNDLDEAAFQALYGRWDAPQPAEVAGLLAGSPAGYRVRWWIAGGRAARAGATARPHDDTDIAVRLSDLHRLRTQLSGWHLWEANSGTLRPLLPGDTLTPGCEQPAQRGGDVRAELRDEQRAQHGQARQCRPDAGLRRTRPGPGVRLSQRPASRRRPGPRSG